MSKTTFVRSQQGGITDCVGREDYIKNPERQEKLVHYFGNEPYEDFWKDLHFESHFGNGNRDAQEYIFELPNSLKEVLCTNQETHLQENDSLKWFEDYIKEKFEPLGVVYTVGVHNKPTNLHAHVMFSERKLEHPDNEPTTHLKREKARHYYYIKTEENPKGKSVAKKVYDEWEGEKWERHKDKKIIEVLDNGKFGQKNEYLASQDFLEEVKLEFTELCNKVELELKTGITWDRHLAEGHIPQIHVGNHIPDDTKEELMRQNEVIKEHNALYDSIHDITQLKDIALDKLQDMYQEVKQAIVDLDKQIKGMLHFDNTLEKIGKLFDSGQSKLDRANAFDQAQTEKLDSIGKVFDLGQEKIEHAEEIKLNEQYKLERTFVNKSVGEHSL